MEERSKRYAAFTTPDGTSYEFDVMPFGLTGAPGTFQKLMNEVLRGYFPSFTKVYLNDVVIYSRTLEEHDRHFRRVFERFRQHGLCVSPEKCTFAAAEIAYLGHLVTGDHDVPRERHLHKIREYPAPRNVVKELRQFLGVARWLREYVPHFATKAAPLTDLLDVNSKYQWTFEEQEAFEGLKEVVALFACYVDRFLRSVPRTRPRCSREPRS